MRVTITRFRQGDFWHEPVRESQVLDLPDEWGPRFYRKFSQKPEFKDLPVVVISGLSGIHLAIRKAVATVNKPFNPDQVIEIVENTIGAP